MRARAHVEERQQHLGGLDAALAQVLVVGAIEPPLSHRRRGLELLHHPRARREPQQVDAARDRARGDDDHVDAAGVQRGDLLADPRDDREPQRAGVLGDDRRPELDDGNGQLPGGIQLEDDAADLDVVAGLEARAFERADHAHPPQPRLDQRLRLLVLEVPAGDQPLDRLAVDQPGAVGPARDVERLRLGRAEDRELGDLVLPGALGLRRGHRHALQQLVAQLVQPQPRRAGGHEHRERHALAPLRSGGCSRPRA